MIAIMIIINEGIDAIFNIDIGTDCQPLMISNDISSDTDNHH